MTCDDSAFDGSDSDDFQRWYFGGSPPESDAWESATLGGEASPADGSDGEPLQREMATERDALAAVG